MKNDDQISEAKTSGSDTRYLNAITDLARALSRVFDHYSRPTRKRAWRALISTQGKKEVDRLLREPNRPLTRFRKLQQGSFKEWLESVDPSYK